MYNLSHVQSKVCHAALRTAKVNTSVNTSAEYSLGITVGWEPTGSGHGIDSPAGHDSFISNVIPPSCGINRSCQWDIYHNATDSVAEFAGVSNSAIHAQNLRPYKVIEHFLYNRVIVAMCFIGLVGNCINLCILMRKGLKHSSGRIEKFAYSGLVALAFSDLLFCLVLLPHAFIDRSVVYFNVLNFGLVYDVYNYAVINTFTMASTWLTVILALGRYIAVCLPLKARELIGLTFARRTIVVVFVFCALFNMPRFWLFTIQSAECADGGTYYFRFYGLLRERRTLELAYMWVYFLLVTVCPLVILVFCNTHLILALRMSRTAQRQLRATERANHGTNNHITLTLVVIVLMYLMLSTPAEVMNFMREHVLKGQTRTDNYDLAVAIVNTLQTVNFAFNFVPYWIINAQVRRMVHDLCFLRVLNRVKFTRHPSRYSTCTGTTMPTCHATEQTGVTAL